MQEVPKTNYHIFDSFVIVIIALIVVFMFTWGAITTWNSWLKYKLDLAKERSVGHAALEAVEKEIDELKEAFRKNELSEQQFYKMTDRLIEDQQYMIRIMKEMGIPIRRRYYSNIKDATDDETDKDKI